MIDLRALPHLIKTLKYVPCRYEPRLINHQNGVLATAADRSHPALLVRLQEHSRRF